MPDNRIEAVKKYDEGVKYAKKTLFHKPEHVEAQMAFAEAAKLFTLENQHEKAMESFELAAKMAHDSDSLLNEACYLKSAADSCARGLQNRADKCTTEKLLSFLKSGAVTFQKAGKFIDAARVYATLSVYSEDQIEKAKNLSLSMELFEQENKPAQAAQVISDLLDQMVENKQFTQILPLIQRAKQMYIKMKYNYKVDMLCLLQTIICLQLKDMVGAADILDQFDNFGSDEYQMAEKLVKSCQDGDVEAFEAAKKDFGGKLSLGNQQLFLLRGLKCANKNEEML